jgi:hypothetical protein
LISGGVFEVRKAYELAKPAGGIDKIIMDKIMGAKEPRGGGISTTDYADFRGWGRSINTAETRQTRRRPRTKAEQVLNH